MQDEPVERSCQRSRARIWVWQPVARQRGGERLTEVAQPALQRRAQRRVAARLQHRLEQQRGQRRLPAHRVDQAEERLERRVDGGFFAQGGGNRLQRLGGDRERGLAHQLVLGAPVEAMAAATPLSQRERAVSRWTLPDEAGAQPRRPRHLSRPRVDEAGQQVLQRQEAVGARVEHR